MKAICFRSAACLIVMSASALAQDPFGGGTADPFARPPQKAAQAQRAKPSLKANPTGVKRIGAEGARVATAAEDHIRNVLDLQTSYSAVEEPLSDVIRGLSQQHNIPMLVNARSLEEIGLSSEEPISLTLKDVTLRSYLRLALRSLDLTYLVKDEVLQITSLEEAERYLVLQAYSLPDALADKSDELLKALTANVSPDQWQDKGGTCNASIVADVLVVSATEVMHSRVTEFLEKVQIALEKKP